MITLTLILAVTFIVLLSLPRRSSRDEVARFHGGIESLEPRIAPAALVAKFAGGTLTVTGDAATNVVKLQGAGASVEVFDGMTSLGIFAGVKNIVAKLDGGTTATANFLGGGIAGSVTVVENGPSSFTIGASSAIGGALAVTGDGLAQTFSVGDNVTVGKALTFAGGLGADSFTIGNNVSIGGNATFSGAESGIFNVTNVTTISGSLAFKNAATPLAVMISTAGAAGLNVTGKVSYAGGLSDDNLFLGGTFSAGATFADLKGNNGFGLAAGSIVHGSISMTTGAGNDSINIQSGTVDKDVTLKLGSGNNAFRYGIAGSVTISGNLSFTGGAGDDLWQSFGGGMTLGKNLTLQFGDGMNTATAGVTVGGTKVSITTGSGTDSISIDGSALNAAVVVSLGAGTDSLGGVLMNHPLSAKYDGGAGVDHFVENSLTANPAILIGFEDFS
ncbi:MAG: hypothetical protein WCF18_19670 [Chthoniobacteraceae bacterium]